MLVIGRDNIYLRPDADKDIIDRGVVDQEAVTSQAQLILSRDLASEVIAKLKLNELPEFDPALGNISLTKRVLGFLGVIKNPLAMTPEERVLEAFYDRLTVFPVEKSRVIVIDFLSEEPELAAQVANAIADAYLALAGGEAGAGPQRRPVAVRRNRQFAHQGRRRRSDGRAPRAASLSVAPTTCAPGAAARRSQRPARHRARAKVRRGAEGQAHPRMLESGEPIDLRRAQFGADPPAVRAGRDPASAACRAILLAPRQHPRIKELRAQIADLESRSGPKARPRALARERRQARRRAGRRAARH